MCRCVPYYNTITNNLWPHLAYRLDVLTDIYVILFCLSLDTVFLAIKEIYSFNLFLPVTIWQSLVVRLGQLLLTTTAKLCYYFYR